MILESIVVIGFAILLDLLFGDPKNRFHPTACLLYTSDAADE